MYGRLDESVILKLLDDIMPKSLIHEVVEYGFAKCVDCNHYLEKEYKCSDLCSVGRCKYDKFVNSCVYGCKICYSKMNTLPKEYIKCIIIGCKNNAECGYKNIICYCDEHAKNKTVLVHTHCYIEDCFFQTNMREKNTKDAICKHHMKPHEEYEFMYEKIE